MDNLQQKFLSLSFYGIFKEACKAIFSAKKTFTLATLPINFLMSLLMFFHLDILHYLITNLDYNYDILDYAPVGSVAHKIIISRLDFLWAMFVISNAAYFVLVCILYILSTSVVVYTMVCVYVDKVSTTRDLLNVVLKVSRRFMIRRVWLMLLYHISALGFLNLICVWNLVTGPAKTYLVVLGPRNTYLVVLVFLILPSVNVLHLGFSLLDWHLGCMLSIFEGSSDTNTLLKGRKGLSRTIAAVIQLPIVIIMASFYLLAVRKNLQIGIITLSKVACWIISIIFFSLSILLGLAVHTVIYFVCQTNHGQNMDKARLAAHLEAYGSDN